MSLIEQALRKVQDPVLRAATTEAPAAGPEAPPAPVHPWPTQPTSPPVPRHTAEPTNALVVVASAIVSLVVVLLIAGAVWLGHTLTVVSPERHLASTPQPTAAPSPTATEAPREAAPPPKEESPKTSSNAMSLINPLLLTDMARISKSAATASPVNHSAPVVPLALSGIVRGSGEPYALINNAIVGVGETIEGYTLVEIGNEMVRLRGKDGDEIVLRVPR